MREFSVAAALAAALVLAGEARAQSGMLVQPGAGGAARGYGGGFIEMLMTGGDPGLAARPLRPAPLAPDGSSAPGGRAAAYGPPLGLDPDEGAAPGYPAPGYGRPAYGQPAYGQPSYGPAVQAPRLGAADPRYRRQTVEYHGPHRPGTIVIDTPSHHLYLVQAGGQALRYGIGVGRPGFAWAGLKTVSMKREWPDWTPPAEMLLRRPDLPRHMAGGPENPLGARALYLGSSLYRIHGTNEPDTIGQSVSSGCIRMMNDDVVDLYDRVGVGTKVIVI